MEVRIGAPEPGVALRGTIAWNVSSSPPCFADTLERPGQVESHTGNARIVVPEGSWLWLKATLAARADLIAYRLVAPFAGRQTLEIAMSARRSIHAFAVNDRLDGPSPAAALVLWQAGFGEATLRRVATTTADSMGYARFSDLAPGIYAVTSVAVDPNSPAEPPSRLVLPAGLPPGEMPVTVVAGRPWQDLRVTAAIPELPAGTGPCMLYLQRVDPAAGPFPLQGVLGSGTIDRQVRVPCGTYALAALPQGVLATDAAEIAVRPGADAGCVARFTVTGAVREVELAGIPVQAFPITVTARGVGDWSDYGGAIQVGPHQWRTARQTLRVPPGTSAYVARSRVGTWVSAEEGEGADRVQMVEAAVIEFRSAPAGGRDRLAIEVRDRAGRGRVPLWARLVSAEGRDQASLAASAVVRQGTVRLIPVPGPDGLAQPAVEVEADRALLRVVIP